MTKRKLAVKIDELVEMTGMSKWLIYKMVREGDFPRPRKVGGRRVVWLVSEVEKWLKKQPHSDNPPVPKRALS
ncbi:AlpA family phage regulatory protein [Candidatus Parcubacteria bacterium]|nr:MAG: AlpA family phage regulatory protein [Candidatus Parcubacteria bacterium]